MQNSNSNLSQQVYLITDLEKIFERNRLTLRRWWIDGNFPKPVKLNGTTLVWHSNVILNWVNQPTKIIATKAIN